MRILLVIVPLLTLQACSTPAVTNIDDAAFITRHEQIFDGYLRGATFNHSDGHSDLVNLYIRRVGSSLTIKPTLYFSTGETVMLDTGTFVQVTLPRARISRERPFTMLSHGDKYLQQTVVWLQDKDVHNIIIDHNINGGFMFFLGFGLGLGMDTIDVSSFVIFPQVSGTDAPAVMVNTKRFKDCVPEQCADRIKAILEKQSLQLRKEEVTTPL